ncbi:RNA-directed DNA polymerase, eukaryota [Tanacetum coccineum]
MDVEGVTDTRIKALRDEIRGIKEHVTCGLNNDIKFETQFGLSFEARAVPLWRRVFDSGSDGKSIIVRKLYKNIRSEDFRSLDDLNVVRLCLLGVLMMVFLGSVSLSSSSDRWICDCNGEGVFHVKDIRSALDDHFLPSADVATRWVKFVPIKVNIFAWRARLNRLPTRGNLLARGVSLDSSLCPICNELQEDSDHLFFSCDLGKCTLQYICRWWNLQWEEVSSFVDWYSWFSSIRLPIKLKTILEGVFYTSWWHIWSFRNRLIFYSSPPRRSVLFDDIVSSSFTCFLLVPNKVSVQKRGIVRLKGCNSLAAVGNYIWAKERYRKNLLNVDIGDIPNRREVNAPRHTLTLDEMEVLMPCRNVSPIDIYRHILAHDEKIAAQDVKIKQLDDELQANRDSRQEARTSTKRKKSLLMNIAVSMTLVNFKTRRASNGSGSPRHMTLAESMPEICPTKHSARSRVRLSSTPFEPR